MNLQLKKVKYDNKNDLENISKEKNFYRQLNSYPNLGLIYLFIFNKLIFNLFLTKYSKNNI